MIKKNRVISSAEAINEALLIMGKKDKDILLMAEGIDDPSSIFGTTKGLRGIYGDDRVIEMPTSENAICGIAIGSSIFGKRPIVTFHRVEFALLALEQIVNNAAKAHYASNGKHKAPIIIRLIVGRGWGQGPQHSQSLETIFASIPGLKVIMPTFPHDYKGMLINAIEDNNPVIIIEHRWTHYLKGKVETGYYKLDIEKPKKIMTGKDATIVSSSYSTIEALRAGKILKQFGITFDLFDLRSARPLKLDKVFKSVKKTGSLITVDIGSKILGLGSEIITQTIENCFVHLKSKPIRIGLPDHPIPSSRGYIPNLYPDTSKIIEAIFEQGNLDNNLKIQALKIDNENKKALPVDIPDNSFQGPF